MGKLYNLIKDKYEALISYQTQQETNYLDSMKFEKLYDTMLNIEHVNQILNFVNKKSRFLFGSKDSFKTFLSDNKDLFSKNQIQIPLIKMGDTGIINAKDYDIPKIYDAIEKVLGDKKVDELIEQYNSFTPSMLKEAVHPFNELIKNLVDEIKDYGFNEKELNEYTESLNFLNNELIEKQDDGEIDTIIDKLSLSRDTTAKNKVVEFGNNHNLDGDKLKSLGSKNNSLIFVANNPDKQEYLSNYLSLKPVYSEEYKQKLLQLDKLINEKELLTAPQGAESDKKEYGFIDYFVKAEELKNLINNQSKIDDFGDKIDNIKRINEATKEFKDIINKYDDVIKFIKNNFDINEISLPANVYSGRKYDNSKNGLEYFVQNLPERWDKKNAPYGVILNGYSKLKALSKESNVSLEEFINDPVKNYLKGVKEKFAKEDEQYLLRQNSNPLGKRIARALIMDSNAYVANMMESGMENRGIEFINATMDNDANMIDNMIIVQSGISLFQSYNHSSNILFNENDYDSIKNLFALGNKTDNLFSVSKNYFDENMQRGGISKTYDNKISSFKNVNPLNESRRVLETLKNFMVERKNIDENKDTIFNKNGVQLQEPFKPANLFVGAKLYFNDFIFKNNINILSLGKKERQEVFDFLLDPVSAFEKKYGKNPNILFKTRNGQPIESFSTLKQDFKNYFGKTHNEIGNEFVTKFAEINNNPNNLNRGKPIQTIINDNKRNFIKRFFSSSSKEYRALTKFAVSMSNPESQTYGDLKGARLYANKYLEHKLPKGVNIESLSLNEKRRVEFCFTIIKTCDEIEKDKVLEENLPNVISKDNQLFQNKIQKDLELDMDNDDLIIDNEINNEIENKIDK